MRLWTAVRLAAVAVVASLVPGVHTSAGSEPHTEPSDSYAVSDNGSRAGAGLVIPAVAGAHSRIRSTAPPELGIPGTVLDAYRGAAVELTATEPGCRLTWQMLAGVGKVESSHAGNGNVNAQGDALRPILGPVLDGSRSGPAIRDTDRGRLDRNPRWDRAVGPLQFIPGSWARYASDGNGDGIADPQNVYDAALATGRYLCDGRGDLSRRMDLTTALYAYNHSLAYVHAVLAWIDGYTAGEPEPLGDGRRGPSPGSTASPSPGTTGSPSPTASPSPSSGQSVSPSPGPTVSPSPGPTLSPSPGPTLSPSPGPTLSPSPTSTPTASPTSTPTASPTPTATPSPTPTPSPSASSGSPTPVPTVTVTVTVTPPPPGQLTPGSTPTGSPTRSPDAVSPTPTSHSTSVTPVSGPARWLLDLWHALTG